LSYNNTPQKRWSLKKWLLVGIPSFIVFLLIVTNIFTIPAGTVGVGFNPFSKYNTPSGASSVNPQEYLEGIHVKMPWVGISIFNVKTQDYTMSIMPDEGERASDVVRTVTSEGLYVDLDITVLYKLISTKADEVRRTLGLDGEYQDIIVRPAIRSVIREVVSRFEAADIYGEGRKQVQDQIEDELFTMLTPRGIMVESILLRDVGLPPQITTAIEAKKQAEQEAMRMEYVIQKEQLEKQRKLIEAEGISAANKEISGSLTTQYLTWYWITSLEPEDVIYMIPSDGGLPLFKGMQ
jgi:regulator of protease activity HflC (stomatin/prohibitin superfamily)